MGKIIRAYSQNTVGAWKRPRALLYIMSDYVYGRKVPALYE